MNNPPRVVARLLLAALAAATGCRPSVPVDTDPVAFAPCAGCFALVEQGRPAALAFDAGDERGVARAVERVRRDLERVTGVLPDVIVAEPGKSPPGSAAGTTGGGPRGSAAGTTGGGPRGYAPGTMGGGPRDSVAADAGPDPAGFTAVWAGTVGSSTLVDGVIDRGLLDASGLVGRREKFEWHVVEHPAPGVDRALVIAGSDRRGTIYGLYELSAQAGVSAWEWWADVPVARRDTLYVRPVVHTLGEPVVRYRGIFLNDENPALLGFANETFGGFNHRFYERVFELILRLKGNFLWPAMWGKALADDDELTAPLADEMGIVLGTSHHEPMARAHVEWARYGDGPWNWATNGERLDAFWAEGIRRMKGHESLVTVGMRGDGDEPMTEGTAISLLERIVERQRNIIGEVSGRDPSQVPQVWALYKEVQDYYDAGMRVPDDVTLLFSDDNWGNVRRLPAPGGASRAGGYGVYYHFDYVGDPRNYKWLNTNQIQRVQEQMNLAYERGATRIWIVNVGDLKPMEFPTEFFLDLAWNPARWPADRPGEYTRLWAARQFPPGAAGGIADLLDRYARYAARRKPELLDATTYSLTRFREAERVLEDWRSLAADAGRVEASLGVEYADAYFQLVLFPVLAMENLHELYHAAALNHLHAGQGRSEANRVARIVEERFARDRELAARYHALRDGKWNHMMSQTHIGYDSWQEPSVDRAPDVEIVHPLAGPAMGVSVEGSDAAWPGSRDRPDVAALERYGPAERRIEVFSRGDTPFDVTLESGAEWVRIEPASATVPADGHARVHISVDFGRAPAGETRVPILVNGPERLTVYALVRPAAPRVSDRYRGFMEADGVVAVEARHYARAVESQGIRWVTLPGLGKTDAAVTPLPAAADPVEPGGESPRLDYAVWIAQAGEVDVHALFSPSLDVLGRGGLRYAVSIDNGSPRIVNLHEDASDSAWRARVAGAIHASVTTHALDRPGEHVVRIWMVDPGIVLQRIVVTTGTPGERARPLGALGPPESRRYGP